MITLSPEHTALRAAGALAATLALFNSGTLGPLVHIYGTTRPDHGVSPGGSSLADFQLPNPAGSITNGVFTLAEVPDALILFDGTGLWARFEIVGSASMDCNVSDELGTGTIKLSTTTLYAGGLLRLASGTLV